MKPAGRSSPPCATSRRRHPSTRLTRSSRCFRDCVGSMILKSAPPSRNWTGWKRITAGRNRSYRGGAPRRSVFVYGEVVGCRDRIITQFGGESCHEVPAAHLGRGRIDLPAGKADVAGLGEKTIANEIAERRQVKLITSIS